jgi:uncharacterized membrane protein
MHIIHVLTVILWIGGLAFITVLILPMVVKMPDALQKVLLFQRIEHKFAPLARVYAAITGISGFVMFYIMNLQSSLFSLTSLPLLFMITVWIFWVVMLFGLEPIIIKKMLDKMAGSGEKMEIEIVFLRMNRLHWLLLFLSLAASAAGAIFSHDLF